VVRVGTEWVIYSDLDVSRMESKEEMMATASLHSYVLFYERQ
jgi:ubiquitin C-terminal hydrolase